MQLDRYQCSFSTFERAGYSQEEAKVIMLKSVDLAHKAQILFHNETQQQGENNNNETRIALSLGPFGASLTPGREFDGYYPPPYGPKAYSVEGENCNSFGVRHGRERELKSIDALAQFHYERLLVFLSDTDTWNTINCLAFETVPLVREVRAIKKTMAWLKTEIDRRNAEGVVEIGIKPWWISFVFPDGQFPETRGQGGTKLTAREVVAATLDSTGQDESTGIDTRPFPTGLGVNCTPIGFVPGILKEMVEAVEECWDKSGAKPWLIVYPNGGGIYDPVSQTWHVQEGESQETKGHTWAEELGEIVVRIIEERTTWGGIVVGGCCKTGPDQIRQLSRKLSL